MRLALSDTKIAQGNYQKTTINIPHKHRCKNPRQTISKSNPAIYKNNAHQSGGIHPADVKQFKNQLV